MTVTAVAPRIRVGTLQPGAVRLNIGVTGARRGVAEFGGGSRAGVIVKAATPLELAVECFCALLAQDLGLSAPDCAIVSEGSNWLFASVDLKYPNLLQAFKCDPNAPDPALLQIIASDLAGWVGIGRLLAFDVLVKNADRHVGNLLTDGADFMVIDHARSLDAFPYKNMQPIFKMMNSFLDSGEVQSVRQKAISASLTFPSGCHILPTADLSNHFLTLPFGPDFETLITNRLVSISSTVNSNL